MTLSLERPSVTTIGGDEAYEIIQAHREQLEDRFRVDHLGDEFLTYSQQLGWSGLYLARADDNLAGTFKHRGATVAIEEMERRGVDTVSTVSTGNALIGCAAALGYEMALNGCVTETAAPSKVAKSYEVAAGKNFYLHTAGRTVDDTLKWQEERPELGELVPPFDHPNVIAGQGTLTDDILAEHDDVKHIVAAVGGAGLVAGMLQRLNELGRSDVVVHAAQAAGSNSLSRSLENGRLTVAELPNMRYGGSAVRTLGHHTFEVCRRYPNLNVFTVDEGAVDDLIDTYEQDRRDLMREDTPNYEPTTLVAVAGTAHVRSEYPTDDIVVVGSGHNDVLRPGRPSRSSRVLSGTFPK